MAEFTPIASQEEFDALIKDRLERERAAVRKEFADYEDIKNRLSAAEEAKKAHASEVTTLQTQISELTAKLSASETDSAKTRIAFETGIPFELRDRLTGTTEDEIRADAQNLVKIFNSQKRDPAPLYNPEPVTSAEGRASAAFSSLSESLKN